MYHSYSRPEPPLSRNMSCLRTAAHMMGDVFFLPLYPLQDNSSLSFSNKIFMVLYTLTLHGDGIVLQCLNNSNPLIILSHDKILD